MGSIHKASDNYWTYTITAKTEVLKIIKSLNGKLVLKKTNARLKHFLESFNRFHHTRLVYREGGIHNLTLSNA